MPRTQASLPDPSGIGFVVLLLLICVLVVVNSIFTSTIFFAFSGSVRWLKEPRLAQPVLFLAPLLMLSLEIWIGSRISRLWTRPNGGD